MRDGAADGDDEFISRKAGLSPAARAGPPGGVRPGGGGRGRAGAGARGRGGSGPPRHAAARRKAE
ncbi:hypothetical protein EHM82_02595, partial [bacterium]